ncbi:MAG TPA: tRNA-dihydrouridine synthase family protein [Phycisphaerales bacterium]|nr:tRNA-dihydrouridine synthase family protein [Phycisphaerales bacterium]
MSCDGNNATPPSPGIAPGAEHIDPAAVARELGLKGPDPRITALVPGFDAPFFQAGLAGYSDAAMRIIARRHGCPFCVTEALLDRTLLGGGRGFLKADLGDLHENVPGGPEDHPLACQIMGSDPHEMAAAALKVAEQGTRPPKDYRALAYAHRSPAELAELIAAPAHAMDPTEGLGDDTCETLIDEVDEVSRCHGVEVSRSHNGLSSTPGHLDTSPLSFETIDINLACPVKKIKAKARGGHWLAQPEGAIDILGAVREAVPAHIRCTVKLRRSFDDTPQMAANLERILDAAFDMDYAWATIHARTVQQKYIGPSRWDLLRSIVHRRPGRLIFGSGDIWNVHDIFRMIAYTGVSAVAVARGCIGNPWIFRQARQMLAGRPPLPPTIAEQRAVLEDHFRLSVTINGEDRAGKTMRKFGIRFASHHPRAEDVRRRFIAVASVEDWLAVLDEHYERCDSPA